MNAGVLKDPTIIMTAAVYGLLAFIATRAGLFGLWLGILLLISLGRYCYSVLRATAQGRTRIPSPTIESCNPVGEVMVLWHIVLFQGLIVATAPWQPWGLIVAAVVAGVFPASAALMGLTGDIAYSLNPGAIRGVTRSMGRDYSLLVGACLGVFIGASVLFGWIAERLGFLTGLLAFIVDFWALLAAFALIGSALREHRLEFDIPGELIPQDELDLAAHYKDRATALDHAYASIRSGLVTEGYNTMREILAADDDSKEANYWLFENLLAWQDRKYALEVARRLIGRLARSDDRNEALELYQRCRQIDKSFTLPAEQASSLARFANEIGRAGIADELEQESV